MSLVDYASSDEEDLNETKQENEPRLLIHKSSGSSLTKQREGVSSSPQPLDLRLPDASLLLNSPSMPSHMLQPSDHASRVAVAMANAPRKRDLKGPSSSYPRSKVPKGVLPHPKSVPDTAGGLLVPPQLTGRRNVVTEDISKLFVKKHVDSSS
ncbi:hypothetical protein LIER_27318 [Lithospermum erythrorhizon]|uniref:Uncharacterized protein n=1 Tax=Lithospermum erythrorhizon TaxID=34254 RepID=A0AAV3RBV8_LITER